RMPALVHVNARRNLGQRERGRSRGCSRDETWRQSQARDARQQAAAVHAPHSREILCLAVVKRCGQCSQKCEPICCQLANQRPASAAATAPCRTATVPLRHSATIRSVVLTYCGGTKI